MVRAARVRPAEWARPAGRKCHRASRAATRLLIGAAGALGVCGCAGPAPRQEAPSAAADWRSALPDVPADRILPLFDFEADNQQAAFRIDGAPGATGARPPTVQRLDEAPNRPARGGLRFALTPPDEALVCDLRAPSSATAPRDWSTYPLLVLRLLAPADALPLEIELTSGDAPARRWQRSIACAAGWNTLRVDLAAAGDEIDLSDVAAIHLRCRNAASEPVELGLGGIALADNTEQLLGRRDQAAGLYVLRRGPRLVVGETGRFEVAFADGVIVRLSEPGRQNLSAPEGLGPWPVPLREGWNSERPLSAAWDDPARYAIWGPYVRTTQRLVEAGEARVVVDGSWRFVRAAPGAPETASAPTAAPGHAWRYTIYPGGEIYVGVDSSDAGLGWPLARVGYALALQGAAALHVAPPAPASLGRAAPLARIVRAAGGGIVWAAATPALMQSRAALESGDSRRLAVLVGDAPAVGAVRAAHRLSLAPLDAEVDESLARAFAHPPRLRMTAGRLLSSPGVAEGGAPGDWNLDGFNETEGCYEVAPDRGLVRLVFDAPADARGPIRLRIHESAGHVCRASADGRLIPTTARDGQGRVLLRLPASEQAVELEVRVE